MQLIAVGPNQPINYDDKKSHAPFYKIYKFNGNRLQLQRIADMMIPLYIKSDNPIDFLTLCMGGTTSCKIPLDFCNKLNGFKNNSTTTYKYKLPYELFKINIPTTQFNGLYSYELYIESQHICNAKLYCKESIVSQSMLTNLRNPQHHVCFQEQSVSAVSNSVTTLNLNFSNVHKGIFLDNIAQKSIKNVKLVLNGVTRFDYDEEILDEMCQKIGDDCIYISFDCKSFDSDDWNGSLNYSRIRSVDLEIQSKINQTISVKGICANTFAQGGLQYLISYSGGTQALPSTSTSTSTFTFTSKETFKFTTTFIKEKLDDNTCCPIESEVIKKNDTYVKCGKCTGTFLKENIDVWLKTQIKCPICFVKWSNDKVYINSN